MRNTLFGALLVLFCASYCADINENREEFKEEHNKDATKNTIGDNAVANSESVDPADSSTSKIDTTKKPTNYKNLPPNTQGGGNR